MAATEINLIVAAEVNFRVYEEDTTGALLYFTSNNVAVDLSASEINMEIRQTGGTLEETFSSTGGTPDITIGGGSDNEVTIKGWERLPVGTFKYDLEVTTGDEVVTYLFGTITIQAQVTNL